MAKKNSKALEFFKQRIPLYRKDPNLFFREVTLFEPDEWQEKAAKDLAEAPKVSVRSGHGVGKSAFQANACLWFMSCFSYARVVATAPTMRQLHDVLWAEIDKWRANSPLLCQLLTWTKTYLYVNGYERRWFAVARTASQPENIQGFHADNMLFIVDEASGVEDEIMEAVLATLSGGNNKLLMCANPTRTSGTFYDSHTRDRAMYRCHVVSSLDSKRTNKENIAAFIRKYGESSNVVQVRVYGNFPTQEDDVYIPLPLIEGSFGVELDLKKIERISIGCDVARYGDDETVIVTCAGGEFDMPVIRKGQDLMKTVGDIVITYRKLLDKYPRYRGMVYVNIDDTGVGGGVTDRLREIQKEQRLNKMMIVPVNFGSRVPDEKAAVYYDDITTYMWSIIREHLEKGTLKLKDDDELVAQLSIRKYYVTSNGKIQLESKRTMKERGVGSPDRADALALSLYEPKFFNLKSLTK